MKIRIVYHSMTGNTRKVADAMAKALNVTAEDVAGDDALSEPVDLLLVGDGVYAGGVSKAMKKFIGSLSGELVKNAAVFGTFGGVEKATAKMRELLTQKGIKVADEAFSCKGKAWLILNRKHPSEDELRNAGEFARRIAQTVGGA